MGTGRGLRYTEEEDVAIASSYIFRTTNPRKGAEQRVSIFWQDVFSSFCLKLGVDEEGSGRSVTAVESRFKSLATIVQKWKTVYMLVQGQQRSGASFADEVRVMQERFKKVHGSEFKHFAVFEILRTMPKFNPDSARSESGSSQISKGQPRPIGRDAAKAARTELLLPPRKRKTKRSNYTAIEQTSERFAASLEEDLLIQRQQSSSIIASNRQTEISMLTKTLKSADFLDESQALVLKNRVAMLIEETAREMNSQKTVATVSTRSDQKSYDTWSDLDSS